MAWIVCSSVAEADAPVKRLNLLPVLDPAGATDVAADAATGLEAMGAGRSATEARAYL